MRLIRHFMLMFAILAGISFGQDAGKGQFFGPTKAAAKARADLASLFPKEAEKPVPIQPAPPPDMPNFHLSLDWSSQYTYQGKTLSDGAVGIGQFEWNKGDCYMGVRGVFDFNSSLQRNGKVTRHLSHRYDSDRKWRFQEARYYFGETLAFENFMGLGVLLLDLTWTYIQYPTDSEDNSAEIGATFTLPECWRGDNWSVVPQLSLNRDYHLHTSWASCAVFASRQLTDRFELEAYADAYWGSSKQIFLYTERQCHGTGFYAATCGISLNWRLSKHATLTPYLKAAFHPDSRIRRAMQNDAMNHGMEIWGGICAKFDF